MNLNRIENEAFEESVLGPIRLRFGAKCRQLRVRISFHDNDAPLPQRTSLRIGTALKYGMEALLRGWESDRFLSYRITNGVSKMAFPVLVIQPDQGKTGELHSRVPSTGKQTTAENFDPSLVGGLVHMPRNLLRSTIRAEDLLRMPVSLSVFPRTSKICGVTKESMPDNAALKAELELFDSKVISLSVVLRRISSYSLNSGYHMDCAPPSILAVGISAVSGCAIGPYLLHSRANPRKMAGKIFITTEVSPEDLRTLMESAGVVTLRGGASSHAAMICRQIGKVCVVGVSGLSIDGGMLVTDDGQEIPAGIMCMVDGSSGRVIFAIGGINSVIPRATLSEAQRDMLPQLRTVVREGMRVRRKLSRDARNALDQIKEALSEL